MKNLILILTAVILITGCAKRYQPQTVKTDSVFIKQIETVRDTVIKVKADSSSIQLLIECDSLNEAYLSRLLTYQTGTNSMIPEVIIKDRILTVKCKVDSMAVYSKIKEKYHEQAQVKIEKETVEVNRITKFQKVMMWLGWAFIVCVILGTVLKLKKLI